MENEFAILPHQYKRAITASVGFISPDDDGDLFIVIRNKRGWDIPGGHVEGKETPLETFERELKEETQCELLPGAVPIAILSTITDEKTGIFVYKGVCRVQPFHATDEIMERELVYENELIEMYFGNKKILKNLLDLCKEK